MKRYNLLLSLCLSVTGLVAAAGSSVPKWLPKTLEQLIKTESQSATRVQIRSVFVSSPAPREFAQTRLTGGMNSSGLARFEILGDRTNIKGTVNYEIWAKVAVTMRPILKGEGFTQSNTHLVERSLSSVGAIGAYDDLDELSTLSARVYMPPGSVVTAGHTEAPVAVRYGSLVELSYRVDALSIETMVKALASGRPDQWIRVQNPKTKKILEARVVGAGRVQIP